MTAPSEQQFLQDLVKKLRTPGSEAGAGSTYPGSGPGLRWHCEALRSSSLSAILYTYAALLFLLLATAACPAQDVLVIDGDSCGMHGSADPQRDEFAGNLLKNRHTKPRASSIQVVPMAQLLAAKEADFQQDRAVEVTAYFFKLKPGSVETCNCKIDKAAFKDAHIELVPDPAHTAKKYRFIVEVTPRMREKVGQDWSNKALRKAFKGKRVTVRGWLFYDGEHDTEDYANDPTNRKGRKNWRATCWEVHPVTSVELAP